MELSSHCKKRTLEAYKQVTECLLLKQADCGWWEGRLSSSALATATAVIALRLCDNNQDRQMIRAGLTWLSKDQNPDGGWGDSPQSPSNLPTSFIVLSAFNMGREFIGDDRSCQAAESFISKAGCTDGPSTVRTISMLYGNDKTFAVPILIVGALSGRVTWNDIPSLPFEFSLIPSQLLQFANIGVVSYALPALIAVGQLLHSKAPSSNPLTRCIRNLMRNQALKKLQRIQPMSGGFLEAQPLTSFVAMSLAASGHKSHPVTDNCLRFLRDTVRPDGSWPIDTDLSVWLTSHACLALPEQETAQARSFLLAQQHNSINPSTGAQPGGWAWTHRSGGVPDVDDTSAALICLKEGSRHNQTNALNNGLQWLLTLQNADGGWPTFCRGSGRLPFDASAPELTAHAIRALLLYDKVIPETQLKKTVSRGIHYLTSTQQADGSWIPLWFGNQHHPRRENPVIGTGRVLLCLNDLSCNEHQWIAEMLPRDRWMRAITYLTQQQNADGGWGGIHRLPSTIEETAIAVEALAGALDNGRNESILKGVEWLSRRVFSGRMQPAPIGLYFANLWYSEELYPLIWAAGALQSALRMLKIE